jgi:hypothetical protein
VVQCTIEFDPQQTGHDSSYDSSILTPYRLFTVVRLMTETRLFPTFPEFRKHGSLV